MFKNVRLHGSSKCRFGIFKNDAVYKKVYEAIHSSMNIDEPTESIVIFGYDDLLYKESVDVHIIVVPNECIVKVNRFTSLDLGLPDNEYKCGHLIKHASARGAKYELKYDDEVKIAGDIFSLNFINEEEYFEKALISVYDNTYSSIVAQMDELDVYSFYLYQRLTYMEMSKKATSLKSVMQYMKDNKYVE